jgi:hypothetical protein
MANSENPEPERERSVLPWNPLTDSEMMTHTSDTLARFNRATNFLGQSAIREESASDFVNVSSRFRLEEEKLIFHQKLNLLNEAISSQDPDKVGAELSNGAHFLIFAHF